MWWRLARAVRASSGCRDVGQPHMRGLGTPKSSVSSHGPLTNIERTHPGLGAHSTAAERWLCAMPRGSGRPRQPPRVVSRCQSASAISQRRPASSRAIATATTPLGFLRACLRSRQARDRPGPRRRSRELLQFGLDPVASGQQHVVRVQVVGDRQQRRTSANRSDASHARCCRVQAWAGPS